MGSANEPAIRWEQDADGVVTLTMDDPTQRVNTLNALFAESLGAALGRLERERDAVTGVIVRSAKPSFLAGGDLNRLAAVQPSDRAEFLADLQQRKSRTRRLERLGRPVVAVLAGAALGGGLELALACHHRIAVDDPRVVVGLPEVTLGLLPGGGGIVRTVLGLGLDRALELILSGARLDVRAALRLGLIDDTAADETGALAQARAWILAHAGARQPWDDDGAVDVPAPDGRAGTSTPADPARRTVVEIAHRVLAEAVDDALRIESEGLADLVVSDAAKATMNVVFFDTVRVRSRLQKAPHARRPTIVFTRTTDAVEPARRTLEPRIAVVDLAEAPHLAADVGAARADAGQVVLDVVDGPGHAPTDVALRVDGLGDGGLVLLHAAEGELADVLPVFSRAGALPIAVRPGHLDVVGAGTGVDGADWPSAAGLLAERLRDALEHPDDVDVTSVRVCGFPSWTGGAARHLEAIGRTTAGGTCG